MVFSTQSTFKNAFIKRLQRGMIALAMGLLILPVILLPSKPALAQYVCNPIDVETAREVVIPEAHDIGKDTLKLRVTAAFTNLQTWLVTTFLTGQVVPALKLMTEQMSSVAMYQTMIIGTFLDAKHQLETQRIFQELQTEAHKDYTPSEDFCWFGTNVRSMAASEQKGRFNTVALSTAQMDRQLGNANSAASKDSENDKANRWRAFVKKYCDPKDNNGLTSVAGSGLSAICSSTSANKKRVNIDVDYTRAIDEPRTIDVDFTNGGTATPEEEDVIALANNLYGNDVLSRAATSTLLQNEGYQNLYFALRSVAAKRSVAENSFSAIVGLKSSGSPGPTGTPSSTNQFLGAVLTELGIPATEVYGIIGNDPSYYAQLEILAKKIYQNPDFYSNLYDKPANVARKGVALKAIELMLDRAIFESQLRQEMATSVLLSSRLHSQFKTINDQLRPAGGN
jgi:hypothetical protein